MSEKRSKNRTERSVTALGALAALGLAVVMTTPVMASEQGEYGKPGAASEAAAAGQDLSMEQVVAKLKEQGFEDIYEVEREHGAYEVKARDAQGGKVKLYVDPRTGEVLRHKLDD